MGRTNATYRDLLRALEDRWQAYRRGLRLEDQAHFDRLFTHARNHADASGLQNHEEPIVPILVSIALAQEKHLDSLDSRVDTLESQVETLESRLDAAQSRLAEVEPDDTPPRPDPLDAALDEFHADAEAANRESETRMTADRVADTPDRESGAGMAHGRAVDATDRESETGAIHGRAADAAGTRYRDATGGPE